MTLARANEVSTARQLINKGVNMSLSTALHFSVLHVKIVEMLRNVDADIHARVTWNFTPLHSLLWHAMKESYDEMDADDVCTIAQFMLDKGADIHARDVAGRTSLFVMLSVAMHKKRNVYERRIRPLWKFLVKNGARLDLVALWYPSSREVFFTFVHFAAIHGDVELLEASVRQGADLDVAAPYWGTALNTALKHKQVKFAKLLLAYGAHDDVPFMLFAGKSVVETFRERVVKGCYVNEVQRGAFMLSLSNRLSFLFRGAVCCDGRGTEVAVPSGADFGSVSTATAQLALARHAHIRWQTCDQRGSFNVLCVRLQNQKLLYPQNPVI